ncbi:coat protein [Erysiphe necator associated tombus-like virus 2]|nr:coat protein [Erysiphe necator associated tombus-like virus 2]
MFSLMYSPVVVAGSNTHHSNCLFKFIFTIQPSFYEMAKKQQQQPRGKKSVRAVVRAPTSISARKTTPSGGLRQEAMIAEVTAPNGSFTLHCGDIPWLKGVAGSYQKWNLSGVRVWFEPRVSTATNGTMHLAFLKDFQDLIPKTVAQISTVSGASRAAVWDKQSLQVPTGKAMEYCSPSSFPLMDLSDRNDRAIGRIAWVADMDPGFFPANGTAVAGRIYMSYTPVLTGPIDPSLQLD